MPHPTERSRSALDFVLQALARRGHNRAELREKARRREFDEPDIDAAISRAEELGVLPDESSLAEQLARERYRKPGATPRMVKVKLLQRGFDSDIADEAVRRIFAGWDADEAARQVAASIPDPARLARKLSRLGFPTDVIAATVRRSPTNNDPD